MLLVKQSASKVVPFFMVDSSDHISPKTGLSPSVQISKAGGSFAAAGGTVAEIGNGWYKITLSSTDTNTLGSLAFYITATGADPVSFSIQVVAFDPESSTDLGLSRIDANISSRSTLTAADVWGYTTRTLTAFSTSLAVAVWDVLESAISTANSIGVKVKTNLDATISSRSTLTDAQVWSYTSRTLTSFGTLVSDVWNHSTRTLTSFSTSLALAVWDVLESAITTANSIGVKVKNNLDTAISSRAPASTALSNTTWTDARAARLDNLDTTVSSRAPASTALSNATWTDVRAAKLDNLDATVSSRSTLTASQVWSHTTRTLTSFGSLVSDIWGYTTSVGVSAVTVLERAYRTLVNKMKVNKSTGSVTLYADNDTGTAATGTVTESDTEVTRSKLTWQ
jgi:hypothetical protein